MITPKSPPRTTKGPPRKIFLVGKRRTMRFSTAAFLKKQLHNTLKKKWQYYDEKDYAEAALAQTRALLGRAHDVRIAFAILRQKVDEEKFPLYAAPNALMGRELDEAIRAQIVSFQNELSEKAKKDAKML